MSGRASSKVAFAARGPLAASKSCRHHDFQALAALLPHLHTPPPRASRNIARKPKSPLALHE